MKTIEQNLERVMEIGKGLGLSEWVLTTFVWRDFEEELDKALALWLEFNEILDNIEFMKHQRDEFERCVPDIDGECW